MELSVQKLILIRGLPGSGKSTQAQSLGLTHYEADMYFVDAQGQYRFCADQLPNAHRWCQTEVERSLAAGESVVVANTFVQRWEIKPYAKLAKRYGVSLEVRECSGQFNNIHGVSDETIQNMKKRWQTWPNDRPSLK
ncbi:ATP-binding protein [Vibrio xiamenensis]|uniref:ATP-binding protein n=1 Tax=Vibrio xiamenensis TaxID=861298 RepID=UPI000B85282B|nr:ATP-binding protein [Vibrio xiamenensis]